MEIKNLANWLRGYLESLSDSDSISKKQIQILKIKMEELISILDENENYIEIRNLANWLRGYLESLSDSDSISKKQIQIVKLKMEELIIIIDENEDYPNDYYTPTIIDSTVNPPDNFKKDLLKLSEDADDLPF